MNVCLHCEEFEVQIRRETMDVSIPEKRLKCGRKHKHPRCCSSDECVEYSYCHTHCPPGCDRPHHVEKCFEYVNVDVVPLKVPGHTAIEAYGVTRCEHCRKVIAEMFIARQEGDFSAYVDGELHAIVHGWVREVSSEFGPDGKKGRFTLRGTSVMAKGEGGNGQEKKQRPTKRTKLRGKRVRRA